MPMMRATTLSVLTIVLAGGVLPASAEDTVKGYAEWRRGDTLTVEGQLVRVDADTRFVGDARSLEAVQLGYEVEAKGEREANGVIVARELKAKPNGDAAFEADVLGATNEIEQVWVTEGRMFEPAEDGSEQTVGGIIETGPAADRVRGIMRRLTPPYVDFDRQIRVHLVDTEEWNAAAMGNGAIWVYTGLVESLSDDELAVVLGHELAHYTHEHSRRQAKSSLWQELLGLGASLAVETLDNETARSVASVAAGLGLTVWSSGYSRGLEDQADRVGLRYAREGGFDVGAGTRLWGKFRDRYGEADSVSNFFFGSHSRATDRIRNIEAEIAINYPSSPPWSFVPVERSTRADAPGTTAASDAVNTFVEQVREQLVAFEHELGNEYSPVSEAMFDTLEPGASVTYEMTVRQGVEYVVFGACDADCDDLDLFAYGARGEEVARDVEADDYPVLQLEAEEDGVWSILVTMVSCSTDTCVFGITSHAR